MQRQEQTQVLVVGAGPVGMVSALLLAKQGIRAQVIDQEPRTATHSYACALHPRSLEILDQAGVAAEAIKLGRRISTIGLYEGGIRRAELQLACLSSKFPFVLVLDQSALEDLLERQLRETAQVEVHWNHRLADLSTTRTGAVAMVERLGQTGKGYSVPGWDWVVKKQLLINAQFVIGADGRNSLVRQRLDLRCEKTGEPELFVVYECDLAGEAGNEMSIVLDADTASVMWPLAEHRCRWSFQSVPADPAGEFPAKSRSPFDIQEPAGANDPLHRLQHLLHERAPWFKGGVTEVGWSSDIQFEHRLAGHFGRDRCWLAGDAAHQTGPVGMQSLNLGLREAADLAGMLKQILGDKASIELLQAYDNREHSAWQRLLGGSGGPKAGAGTDSWVKSRLARLPTVLPAFGDDLNVLLRQLGVEYQ